MICAHQPGSEPIDIPETIPNPVVVPKPYPYGEDRGRVQRRWGDLTGAQAASLAAAVFHFQGRS